MSIKCDWYILKKRIFGKWIITYVCIIPIHYVCSKMIFKNLSYAWNKHKKKRLPTQRMKNQTNIIKLFSLIVGFDSDWIHKLSTIKPTGWLRDCKDGSNGLHWGHSHPRIDTSPGWRCHLSWFWGVWAGGSAYCDTTAAFFPERSSKKFQS